jgi:hypothetical protein
MPAGRVALLMCALAASSCLHARAPKIDGRLVIVDSAGWTSSCVPGVDGQEYLLPPSGVTNAFYSVVGQGERGVAIRARDDLGQVVREIRLPVRMRYYDLVSVAISPRQSRAAWLDPASRRLQVLVTGDGRCETISPDLGITSASIHFMEWLDESRLVVAVYGGDHGTWSRILVHDCETGVVQHHEPDCEWNLLRHALSPDRKYMAFASTKLDCDQTVAVVDAASMGAVTNLASTARRNRIMSLAWTLDSKALLYTVGNGLYARDLAGAEQLVYRHDGVPDGALFIEGVASAGVVLRRWSPRAECFIIDLKSGGITPMREDAHSWQGILGTSKLVYRRGP